MSETQLKQGAIATGIQGVLKKAYGHSAQSHGGVIHLFGQQLIKTGILSRESENYTMSLDNASHWRL